MQGVQRGGKKGEYVCVCGGRKWKNALVCKKCWDWAHGEAIRLLKERMMVQRVARGRE